MCIRVLKLGRLVTKLCFSLTEGYEKLAQLRGEGTSVNSEQVDDELDMFAEDDEKANANPASGEGDLVSGSNSNGNNQPSESKFNNLKCS